MSLDPLTCRLAHLAYLLCLAPLAAIGPSAVLRPASFPDLSAQVGQQSSQQQVPPTEVVRVDVGLVIVPAVVVDREGRAVTDLQRSDFRVFEDGVEQQIDSFESVRAPCSVAILLDTSESTRSRLGEIKQAALRFLDALRPEDRVMIVSFDSAIYVDSEWTSDRLQLRKAALGTRTWRMTRMFDALDLVIRERLQRVRGRKKALVLLGDGIDTHSRLSNSVTTLALVEESNVVLFPVRYDTEGSWQPPTFMIRNPDESIWRRLPVPRESGKPEYEQADRYLKQLAETTGGRYLNAQSTSDLSAAFEAIAEELSHQYSLSYYPDSVPKGGSFHRIKVQVNKSDVSVRARRGYRVAPQLPAIDRTISPPLNPEPGLNPNH